MRITQSTNKPKSRSSKNFPEWHVDGKHFNCIKCIQCFNQTFFFSHFLSLCLFHMVQMQYKDKPIQVDLCNNSKKIEIDYSQSAVKIFFDETAPCGSDCKFILINFHATPLKSQMGIYARFD